MLPEQLKKIGNYSYSTRHCIGQGSYGKVFEGHDEISKQSVAIKQMDLRFFESDKYLKSQLQKEIEVLKCLKHINVVRLIDVMQSLNSLYIVTEICRDGDLRELCMKKKLTENDALGMFFQILDGFENLVQNGIIHRDLKPANILIHDGVYKIADFGFARFVGNFNNCLLQSCVGSPLYMAPQVLSRNKYSTKCDIWSLGVILYEVLFGDTPWKGRDERDLLNNIRRLPLNLNNNQKLSKFTEDTLKRMLTIEEKDRITWEELFIIKDRRIKKENDIGNRENRPPGLQHASSNPNLNGIIIPIAPLSNISINQEHKKMETHQAEYKKYLKFLSALREDLIFKHYVCVQVFSSCEGLAKLMKLKPIYICKFVLLLAQAIKQSSNFLVLEITDKEYKRKDLFYISRELGMMAKVLKKENTYYYNFYEDLIENFSKTNTLDLIKEDKELDGFFEIEISEKNKDTIGLVLIKYGIEFLKSLTDESRPEGNEEDSREILLALDYLIDFLACLKRIGKKITEIDYDSLHKEKSEYADLKVYWERIMKKRSILIKKDGL